MAKSPTKIPFIARDEIERRAAEFLRRLDIPARMPIDSFAIARSLSILVEVREFEDADVAGAIRHVEGATVIEVNRNEPRGRQNFTVAHELGHFELHPPRPWTDKRSTMYRRSLWDADSTARRAESQANLFAASLLMPEDAVREQWLLLKSPHYLAPIFDVSKEAMARRLEELGLTVRSIEGFFYVDFSPFVPPAGHEASPLLSDEKGEIPIFPSIRTDASGKIIPMTEAEQRARAEALGRVLNAARRPDRIDPPGSPEQP